MKYTFLMLGLLISCSLLGQKRFVDVAGMKIWVSTYGLENRQPGQPLVVFESGLGTPLDNWDSVIESVAELGPVIAYDRPGIGESSPDPKVMTLKHSSNRLVWLLDQLGQEPPYILVGHSMGGVLVRGFAVYYPEKLAGLVIIDPADFTETRENEREYYDVLGWDDTRIDSLIQAFIDIRKARNERATPSVRREREFLQQLRKDEFVEINASPLPNIPVHILVGGRFDMPAHLQSDAYDDEALFRSKMKHRMIRWTDVIQSVDKGMLLYSGNSGHFVHMDDPQLALSSIYIVINQYYQNN